MMQETHVKQVVKAELLNKNFSPALVQEIEDNDIKSTETKLGNLSKAQSFNRFLEAFGDCV